MNQIQKDPALWIFSGLILALVPLLILLLGQLTASHSPPPPFVPLPDQEHLLELVQHEVPVGKEVVLKPVFFTTPEPTTGIVAVYDLEKNSTPLYRLVVFRYDIACSTCRDIVAAGLYDTQKNTLARVILLDAWEVRNRTVDTRSFLDQFSGKSLQAGFQLGQGVDGITGATLSTTGLLAQLNEATAWINQQ